MPILDELIAFKDCSLQLKLTCKNELNDTNRGEFSCSEVAQAELGSLIQRELLNVAAYLFCSWISDFFRILESRDGLLPGQTHPSLPVSASIVWLSSVFFKWKIHFSTFYYFSFITEQNHLWQFAGYGDEFLCFQFNRWPFYWINDVLIFDSNQMTSIFCDTNEWQFLTNWKTHDINGKSMQEKIYLDNLRSRMIRC